MPHIRCGCTGWWSRRSATEGIAIIMISLIGIIILNALVECSENNDECGESIAAGFSEFGVLLLTVALGALVGAEAYRQEKKRRMLDGQRHESGAHYPAWTFEASGPEWSFRVSGACGKCRSGASKEPGRCVEGDGDEATSSGGQDTEPQ